MRHFLTILLYIMASGLALSQVGAPKKFNYQAVPRKADGSLLAANSTVKVQFVITEDGSANIRYAEEHSITVSQHGVVSAMVGDGAPAGSLPFDFEVLDWKNHPYFLAVAVDMDGSGTFESSEQFASSQLISVPYALYAEQSGSDGPNYIWGNGLSLDPATSTVSNTGDLNGSDDVLKSSNFTSGDVTGSFDNGLEIMPNTVSGVEIINQSVQAEDLAPGVIPATLPPSGAASGDLSGTYPAPQVNALRGFSVSPTAPASGQVLKWNGAAWAPATDATSGPGVGDNWGTQTANTTLPITGNGTAGSPIGLATNSINSSHIVNGSITQADIATGTIPTVTAGTGISLNPTANGYAIENTTPNQPVTLTGTGATTISGTYPNFTINTPAASGISGSGTGGYISKFGTATTLGNSVIYQAGNNIGIGTINPTGNLDINGGTLALHNIGNAFNMALRSDGKLAFEAGGASGNNLLVLHSSNNTISIGSDAAPTAANEIVRVSGIVRSDGIRFSTGGIYNGDLGSIDIVSGIVPDINDTYFVGRADRRWAAGYLNKIHSSEYIIAGTTSNVDNGASLRVVGSENGGSSAAVRIESGSQVLLMDGNEIDALSSGLYLNNNSSGNVVLAAGGGAVNIGDVTATSGLLNVQGTAYKTGGGSWSSFSDRRLKEKIAPFSAGIDLLEKVNPVTFHYNGKLGMSNVPEYVGVVAQELKEAAPFMVTETLVKEGPEAGHTYLSVDPSAFTYMLINAVKTQQTEIGNLKQQMAAQQAQIDALIEGFEQLKLEVSRKKASESGE